MKKYIALLLLTSLAAWGQQVQISNLNLQLKDGHGRITTDSVHLATDQFLVKLANYDYELEQLPDQFVAKNHDTSLTLLKLDKNFSILRDLKEVTVKNTTLSVKDDLKFSTDYLSALIKADAIDLEGLKFQCGQLSHTIVDSCLDKSSISIKTTILPESVSQKDFMAEVLSPEEVKLLKAARLKVRDFTTTFAKNRFTGSAMVNVLFDVTFDFNGDVKLDRENKRVVISNLEVKRGFIPMTGVVLEAIKRAGIKNVTVVDKTIYIAI